MGLIRLLLAISVIIAHSSSIFGLTFLGARYPVQAFYVISGFYMALILNEKYVHQKHAYRLFITNRFLKLFPVYWIILALTVLSTLAIAVATHGEHLGEFRVYAQYASGMSPWTLCYLVLSNIFLFFQDVALFFALDPTTGHLLFNNGHLSGQQLILGYFMIVPQAWTVGLELFFYLVAPFIVRRSVAFIAFLIVLSFALRALLYAHGLNYDPWTHRFFPTELGLFLLGSVSYRIYRHIRTWNIRTVVALPLLSFIAAFTIFFDSLQFPHKSVVYFFCFTMALPFIFHTTNKSRFDRAVGELSYPVYLSHILLITCIRALHLPSFGGEGLTLTLYTIPFAALLNTVVVKRIETYRQKRVTNASTV